MSPAAARPGDFRRSEAEEMEQPLALAIILAG